jgi:ribosomal protein L15E
MAGRVQRDRRGLRVVVVYARLSEQEYGWVEQIMADDDHRTLSDTVRACVVEAAKSRGYFAGRDTDQEAA